MQPWFKRYADWCRGRNTHKIILDRTLTGVYLERFHIIKKLYTVGFLSNFVHRFNQSDNDFDEQGDGVFHDHPWLFWGTIILEGGYIEHTPKGSFTRNKGYIGFKVGWSKHRIELFKDEYGNEIECWTLFFAGPNVKNWGFKDNKTGLMIPWQTYLKAKVEKFNAASK